MNTILWLICLLAPLASAADPGALYRKMIPEDKQLDPAWIQSLTERGHPLDRGISGSKKDDTLKYIGMPVGGIACGTLVMDGAGQLYSWSIFGKGRYIGVVNQNTPLPDGYQGFRNGRIKNIRPLDGANYMNPPTVEKLPAPVKQGFALRIEGGAEFRLGPDDWEKIEFAGQWPIGTVTYEDRQSPVRVQLEAYSPFIPLDVENSKLPVTVMAFTLTNGSSKPVSVEFDGWLGQDQAKATVSEVAIAEATAFTLNFPKESEGKGSRPGTLGLTVRGHADIFDRAGVKGLRVSATLTPGESKVVPFLISWHFGVNWGSLSLKTLRLNPRDLQVKQVEVMLNGKRLNTTLVKNQNRVSVEFAAPVSIAAGQTLKVLTGNKR